MLLAEGRSPGIDRSYPVQGADRFQRLPTCSLKLDADFGRHPP
jgi:hypothetical protein